MIRVETQLLRETIPEAQEPSANFALLKLFPEAGEGAANLPLSLAIVIDNSGSMHVGERPILHAVDAACGAIDLLGQDDLVSVIAFHDEAKVFCASRPAWDKASVKAAIRSILEWEGGGTNIAVGIAAALEQMRSGDAELRAHRILLLTDGHAEDPDRCIEYAERAAEAGVAFTAMGVGEDWNQPLLERMATLTRGHWHYIKDLTEMPALFRRELSGVKETFARDAVLTITLKQGIRVTRIRQVEPEIADLVSQSPVENEVQVRIFTLQKETPVFLLVQMSISPRVAGRYAIGDVILTYEAAPGGGLRQQTNPVRMVLEVTDARQADRLWQNGDVLRYVDFDHCDATYRRATALLDQGAVDEATQMLLHARSAASRTGDVKKTRMIDQTLQELGRSGRISQETRLSGLQESRTTNLMLEDDAE